MTTYYILSTMPHSLHKWTQFYNNPRAHRAFSEWGNWDRDNLSNITHTTEKDNSRHQVWPLVLPFSLLLADTLTPKNSKDWKRLIPKHIFQRYKYFLLCIISAISQVNTTAESKRFPQGLLCSLYCDTFKQCGQDYMVIVKTCLKSFLGSADLINLVETWQAHLKIQAVVFCFLLLLIYSFVYLKVIS